MKSWILVLLLVSAVFLNAVDLFFDDFEAGIGNWNVVNNGGTGVWQVFSPPFPNTYTLPASSSGNVCAADADDVYPIDSELVIAAPINMAIYDNIILEFDSDFNAIDADDLCYVDVSVDGTNWTNVLFYNGIDVRNTHETIDITAVATLQSSVYLRFHSIQPGYDWWWAIDNVSITGDVAVALTAPSAPTNVLVIPDPAGALSVDLSWVCPATDVAGNVLTELFEMVVYRDEVLIYTDSSPVIGGAGSYTDTNPTNGFHTYNIYGINSSGVGVPVLTTIFVGEDAPASVSNLLLEQTAPGALSATLTWINPTIGLNGGVLNEISGYNIERSDGTMFNLAGATTEYIDDTIPSSDNYWYSVQPYNTHGSGDAVISNTVLIADEGLLIMEDFEGTFPPAGWEIQGGTNWAQGATTYAGGESPEAYFYWSPSTTGIQRLAILPINTVGATELDLEFKHSVNDFNGDYEIRIETSSDGVTWNTAQVIPSATLPATTENLVITTPDVGSGSFQVAWTFDGNSFNINDWYVDDVMLEGTLFTYDDDLAGMTITGSTIVNAGNSEIYEIGVKNTGYNTQNNYNVKLFKGNGTELASLDVTNPIAYGETVFHNLVWQIPSDEPVGIVTLYGQVTLAGDENTANDNTNNLNATVFPPGITEIQVGDGTIAWNRTPVRFQYMTSLSEMLFFPEELNNTIGNIVEIRFQTNFIHEWTNENIAIWMGETTQTNLTDGWIPSTQLTPVFDGNVSFPIGESVISINLDTPYFYNGSNLVMMIYRPTGGSQTGDDNFYHSETTAMTDRTRYEAENSPVVLDPANPPEGWGTERFPNTTFSFFLGAMGEVEGYVYDDLGNPLDNAEIEIDELNMVTYSNAQGFYHFGNVLVGTYDFIAYKFGYSPQTNQAEVLEDQTTTIDFNLLPLGTVTVSGQVVGSDFPTIGLEGAIVSLSGFENYETMTDASGDFEIEGVYTNITYDLIISYEGYTTLYDEAVVEAVNLDLGTIILAELSFPPGNVQAVQNAMQTEVDLTWNSPGQGGGEFRYDDGVVDFEIGFSSAPANGVFGAVHPNIAVIQEVQWYLTSTYGTHPSVKILVLGLNGDGMPDVNQVYLISNLIDNVDDEWNSLILDDEITAQEGFFVGVITPNLYTSVALDDGEDEPWIFQPGTQMSNENYLSGNNWTDIGDVSPIFQKNLLIRAYGINMGNTLPEDFNRSSVSARINKSETVEQTFPRMTKNKAATFSSSGNDSETGREFESYNIYRFPFYLHNTPASWDLIASTVTDTFYTDTSWSVLPLETYQFALTSLHTNGVESMPAFSQALDKTLLSADPEIIPIAMQLHNNHPNPFNPTTTIRFSVVEGSDQIELAVYNMKGQKVKTLINEHLEAGNHLVIWNGTNESGNEVASGLYFYKMKAGKFSDIKKMILLK